MISLYSFKFEWQHCHLCFNETLIFIVFYIHTYLLFRSTKLFIYLTASNWQATAMIHGWQFAGSSTNFACILEHYINKLVGTSRTFKLVIYVSPLTKKSFRSSDTNLQKICRIAKLNPDNYFEIHSTYVIEVIVIQWNNKK